MNSPTKKEECMANLEQYRAVLEDLFTQRSQLQFKIGEIDAAIGALQKLMPAEQIASPKIAPTQAELAGMPGKYSGMGVRWAVLNLLAEDAVRPMRATEIVNALRLGGLTSTGKNFRGNVSAVLSDMNRKRGEVEPGPDGGWKISQKGKDVWIRIRASRNGGPSIFPLQPSLQ
jgi:hypothetical protein